MKCIDPDIKSQRVFNKILRKITKFVSNFIIDSIHIVNNFIYQRHLFIERHMLALNINQSIIIY